MTRRREISSEQQFQRLMEEVDHRLKEQHVPIHSRALNAVAMVAADLAMPLPAWVKKGEPREGSYEGADLSNRIYRWFDERYGRRQRFDMRPGRTVVILRGDTWELWLPRFFGSHSLFASPTEPSDPSVPRADDQSPPPRYNVLDSITDLPIGFRRILSEDECSGVSDAFQAGVIAFELIERMKGCKFVEEALSDYDAGVYHLFTDPPQAGLSKWASLQEAEKLLKSFVAEEGGVEPPRTHDLATLAEAAEGAGMGPVPRTWLMAVQCSPGVRYGEEKVDVDDAVVAHYRAMDIGAHVASFVIDSAGVTLSESGTTPS